MSRQVSVLKLRLETENFNAGRTAFQQLATDAKTGATSLTTLNTNLQTLDKTSTSIGVKFKTLGSDISNAGKTAGSPFQNLNTQLQQVDKTSTSVGSKLKNFGKTFAGSVANVGALSTQVFNLSRQYQDLTDTQIRVDRTSLKMSKTAEAETKARAKLQQLVDQGVTSGAAYEQAMTDVQQADEAATLAVTMHGEALEDQQRAYENFAMNLAPTVVSAGGTIIQVFKDIGGQKGIGGLTKILTGLKGGIGGIAGSFSNLIPSGFGNNVKSASDALSNLGGSAGGITKSMGGATTAMGGLKGAMLGILGPIGLAIGAAYAIIQVINSMQDRIDELGLHYTKFGGVLDTEGFKKGMEEFDKVVGKEGLGPKSVWDLTFGFKKEDVDILKKNGVIDQAGNFIEKADTKSKALKKTLDGSIETAKSYGKAWQELGLDMNDAMITTDSLTSKNKELQESIKGFIAEYKKFVPQTGGLMNISDRALYNKLFEQTFGGTTTQQKPVKLQTRFSPETIQKYLDPFKNATPVVEGFADALAAFEQKGNAALAHIEQQMIKNANAATLFDANFKPLPQTVQQLVGPLDQATASLKEWALAHRTNVQVGIDNAIQKFKDFKTNLEITNAETAKYRDLLVKGIGMEEFTKTAALTTDQLEQLYIAASKSPEQFYALLKSLKETNMALWETGKAASVAYGELLPADKKHGIPAGGRSGKLRVRSDYVRPLIGSPQAQQQMIQGSRPKEFARGSAEIAKLASQIKIGDNMIAQGDKYTQGVGKMVAANKTLKQDLGNMPASLIPVNKAVAGAGAAVTNTVKPATTAVAAMNAALKNIPKTVTPQVIPVVQSKPVADITTALKNVPKTVTPKVTAITNKPVVDAMARAIANIRSKTITVHANLAGNAAGIISRGGGPARGPQAHFTGGQHGLHKVVKRPTLLMVGEGHRQEQVDVTPRGSIQRSRQTGGGFHGSVNVFIGGRRIIDDLRYEINDNQAIFK